LKILSVFVEKRKRFGLVLPGKLEGKPILFRGKSLRRLQVPELVPVKISSLFVGASLASQDHFNGFSRSCLSRFSRVAFRSGGLRGVFIVHAPVGRKCVAAMRLLSF
jgi:hypothetical protein